jgi:hypothetical protein
MSLAVAAALLAASQPAGTPRAFVERVYSGYRVTDYNILAHPKRVFASQLAAAIRQDARLSRGEVGLLDGDPLCQCQDPAGLEPIIGEVRQDSRKSANARIRLRFPGYEDREVRLFLIRTPAGWRIADVAAAGAPSLLGDLRRSNRERR